LRWVLLIIWGTKKGKKVLELVLLCTTAAEYKEDLYTGGVLVLVTAEMLPIIIIKDKSSMKD